MPSWRPWWRPRGRRLYPGQGELDLSDGSVPAGHAVITAKSSAVLWQVLTDAYSRLGFDVVADAAFRQLVLARIVEPTSKADSLRVLDEIGVEHPSLRTMFRTLKRAATGGYRDQVAAACFAHAGTSGDVSLVLYDVTTLYFEAERRTTCARSATPRNAASTPRSSSGCWSTGTGFPLEIGCFEGNKAETTTIDPDHQGSSRPRHGLADMVVVADAGMLSATNLRELDEAGLRFIVGSRVTKAPIDLASHFRWHGDAFTDGQVIDTLTPQDRARRRSRTTRRSRPNRSGTPASIPGRGGRCGRTRRNGRSGTARP